MRLDGIDAARGLALCGMLFAHFASASSPSDAGWLQALDNMADGRAAPLFCVLLGVGAGLYVRRRGSVALAARGLLLLAIGLAIWPYVDRVYLILPQYGVLLVLVAACARAVEGGGSRQLPSRWLLVAAVVSWLVPSAVVAVTDGHGLRGDAQPDTYGELAAIGDIAWQILWSGGYPVIGWTGFALVGLWLSRLRLTDPGAQTRLVAIGVAVAALQPVFAGILATVGGETGSPDARGFAAFLDSTAHSNQTAWYVVATGSALAVIGACLVIASRMAIGPLALLGRNAFSLYLLHLLVGAWLVWPWRDRAQPSLAVQVAVAIATLAAFAALAQAWSRRFERGPVEAAVRVLVR